MVIFGTDNLSHYYSQSFLTLQLLFKKNVVQYLFVFL